MTVEIIDSVNKKPKVGDIVWYEPGNEREKAQITAIRGNTLRRLNSSRDLAREKGSIMFLGELSDSWNLSPNLNGVAPSTRKAPETPWFHRAVTA